MQRVLSIQGDADGLVGAGHGDGAHHVSRSAGKGADLNAVIFLCLCGRHDEGWVVAISTRAEHAIDHNGCRVRLQLVANYLGEGDRSAVDAIQVLLG